MQDEAKRAIEAILMVTEHPADPALLAQLTEVSTDEVARLVEELRAEYEAERRGFVIVEVAGGYRFQSHPDLAPYLERYVLEGQTARLSSAGLETLAIVAYKQPISRAQVAAIRGVNVDGVMRTLEQRGYIAQVGREPGPGNPILFGTTPRFLEALGLSSVDDLPPLASFVPGADVVEQLEAGLRADAAMVDEPTADEPTAAESTAAEPTAAESTAAEPTADDGGGEGTTGGQPADDGRAEQPPAPPAS